MRPLRLFGVYCAPAGLTRMIARPSAEPHSRRLQRASHRPPGQSPSRRPRLTREQPLRSHKHLSNNALACPASDGRTADASTTRASGRRRSSDVRRRLRWNPLPAASSSLCAGSERREHGRDGGDGRMQDTAVAFGVLCAAGADRDARVAGVTYTGLCALTPARRGNASAALAQAPEGTIQDPHRASRG